MTGKGTTPMEYRNLGDSSVKVSTLCLGTMMFGRQTDGRTAQRIVAHARDCGVNFIDTADVYNDGESERVVGKAIARDRHRWVLATKFGNPMGEDPNRRGLGRRWVMQAIDESLARLGTDYVDLYYIHHEDLSTPQAETVGALGDLIRAGKIRYFAISNLRAWRLVDLIHVCRALGVPKPIASQPYYNMLNRMPEAEELPAAAAHGLGVVPYSPLARGVLTAKYQPGAVPPSGTRAALKDRRMMETEFRPESLRIAQKVRAYAEKRGMSPGHFAVNWVLNHRQVASVIAGPRTFEQWTDYVGALAHGFTVKDEAFVDRLVAPGHPSTPGYTDPRRPVLGRLSRV